MKDEKFGVLDVMICGLVVDSSIIGLFVKLSESASNLLERSDFADGSNFSYFEVEVEITSLLSMLLVVLSVDLFVLCGVITKSDII